MSSAEKRVAQMRANPKGDWRIEDLETVAASLGMKIRKSGGSHAVFSHPATATRLTVPARRPIKPVYIRHFLDMIDEIRGAS
jgi:predicted RNA binding protein YcfA (HicA-like mRNA interferase family)